MKKTVIVYYSKHHGNTKKLVRAIRDMYGVTLVNCKKADTPDLKEFDRIGFVSGIYYSTFANKLLNFAQEKLPPGKDVFFIDTCGALRGNYLSAIRNVAKEKGCRELGAYQCRSAEPTGPFRLMESLPICHPSPEEIEGALGFYKSLGS